MKYLPILAVLLFALMVILISACTPKLKSAKNSDQLNSSGQGEIDYGSWDSTLYVLNEMVEIEDSVTRIPQLDKFLAELETKEQIPYKWSGKKVAFLFKGEAEEVEWVGDFSGWKTGQFKGERLGKSNIWRCVSEFPEDARLDYKIIVDGEWILDPANPHQQWAGVNNGQPNSELRMPKWKNEKEAVRQAYIPEGKVSEDVILKSEALGYEVGYKVFTPYNYNKLESFSSLYVLDGQEYSHPLMGNMYATLNNLIAKSKIEPLVVIFIDPRNPEDILDNRRESEFRFNDAFINFITKELIPEIEEDYKVKTDRDSRGIMGTSYGGLCTSYAGIKANDHFSKLGIHSPAYWYQEPKIFDLYENIETVLPLKVFMSTGVIKDTQDGARKMKAIMESIGESKVESIKYMEVNEGHSWGNWKALTDDLLEELFAM